MIFSVKMFRQMVLHVLHLERENGNVLYHLPEKRVVPIEKQMKRSIFSGTCNCGQMVQKFSGHSVQSEKKGIPRKVLPFFRKHSTGMNRSILNSLRNYRKFYSNGKRSWRWFSLTGRSGPTHLQKLSFPVSLHCEVTEISAET